jgi:transposase-like protein
LPKPAQPTAKKMLAEIRDAEDRDHAWLRRSSWRPSSTPSSPRRSRKITDDLDELLAFYDRPAEHGIHLKTSNPIESTFATVRPRTKVTKGQGSRAAGLAMTSKVIIAAQDRWRAINGPHLVALVRAGAVGDLTRSLAFYRDGLGLDTLA